MPDDGRKVKIPPCPAKEWEGEVHPEGKAKRPPGLFPGGRTFADKTWN